ncbi:hypothetical protein [Sediminibacterium goheungense]|uniref:hypothetical protein n=1 Tax=Sediminibacterium goheungense TaxID=1086393 RepID=UPI00105FFBEE|nr:hypothetical protein [Sediminibacterium goheungense]
MGNPDKPHPGIWHTHDGEYGVKEKRPLENFQLEPDITLPYDALINGKDTQIEAAVKEMLRVIGKGVSRSFNDKSIAIWKTLNGYTFIIKMVRFSVEFGNSLVEN